MRYRRVAVNDQFAVIKLRVEKLAADPEQVVKPLSFEGNAGANAGMNEQQIAAS